MEQHILRAALLLTVLGLSASLLSAFPRRLVLGFAIAALVLICADLGSALTIAVVTLGGLTIGSWTLTPIDAPPAIPLSRYVVGLAIVGAWFFLGLPTLLDSLPILPGDTKRSFWDVESFGMELSAHLDGAIFLTFAGLSLGALAFRSLLRGPR